MDQRCKNAVDEANKYVVKIPPSTEDERMRPGLFFLRFPSFVPGISEGQTVVYRCRT